MPDPLRSAGGRPGRSGGPTRRGPGSAREPRPAGLAPVVDTERHATGADVAPDPAAAAVGITADVAVVVEVAVALLTLRQGRLAVLAVPRPSSAPRPAPQARPPQARPAPSVSAAVWQLPAGSWGTSDAFDADALAVEALDACTGAKPFFLEQLRTYTEGADRDVVGATTSAVRRTVTIAYVAVVPEETLLAGRSRAFALDDLVGAGFLPAAHERVVDDAVERVRSKLEYTTVATSLVTEPFTIPELRRVYEAVWGVPLHPANFRRKVLATPGFVSPAPDTPGPEAGGDDRRGPDLYLRGTAALLHPAMLRPQ